jgi:hypothetical protein
MGGGEDMPDLVDDNTASGPHGFDEVMSVVDEYLDEVIGGPRCGFSKVFDSVVVYPGVRVRKFEGFG